VPKSILCLLFAVSVTIQAEDYLTAVLNVSADSTGSVLIVDKAAQKLYVVRSAAPGDLRVIDEYKITTGRREGDKERTGDLKTPEGIYYLTGQVPAAQLTARYGPAAFTLDYPNFVDRREGRTGNNIWIHGRDEAIKDRITEGCISLENSQILDLAHYIRLNRTPVIILASLQKYRVTDQHAYEQALQKWANLVENWGHSWETGAADTYFGYYAESFHDEAGRNKSAFREYKTGLERIYPWKIVRLDRIVVLTSPQETHLHFRQRFLSPTFFSEGVKHLILVPEQQGLKIVRENFRPTIARQTTAEFLEKFLQAWEAAWESKQIKTYLSFYDSTFSGSGYDYRGWCQYKTDLFAGAVRPQISRSQQKVQTVGRQTYKVTFLQGYQADGYHDTGWKTLLIKGLPGALQIVAEEWQSHE